MSANAEKVFHFYEDLVSDVREVVIEEMQLVERCRFTRCSKICRKEAKSSKNFIYSLKLYTVARHVFIEIGFNEYWEFDPRHKGYHLVIKHDQDEKKYLICRNHFGREFWRKELESSTDVGQYGAALFKELLAEYQNRIKSLELVIYHRSLENNDFGIRSLNNLENLKMTDRIDSLQEYFSKLRKPLKYLTVDSFEETDFPVETEEIYQVLEEISLWRTRLSYQQMLRLRAKKVEIPIGNITEMDICNFIQSWQNGTLGKEVKSYRWTHFRDLSFDTSRLFRLLGFNNDTPAYLRENTSFTINHNTDAQRRAILRYDPVDSKLLFKVEDD